MPIYPYNFEGGAYTTFKDAEGWDIVVFSSYALFHWQDDNNLK
jgi:hypothetical protein